MTCTWIDTHCHLDADEFNADRTHVVQRARDVGVSMMVLPAVHADLFDHTARVAHEHGLAYALGIHPLCVARSAEQDIERLRLALTQRRDDPQLVAVGEIGIDYFVPGLNHERQQWFYREQLKLARSAGLPVIVHVRRSADALLKELRQLPDVIGIAHAFNGSEQQAQQFVERGFCLGFGGAMTYEGSRRIRRLAAWVPEQHWVMETDSPDIQPQWLRQPEQLERNEPAQLPRIAQIMAQLRQQSLEEVAQISTCNALRVLPRLAAWLAANRAG